MAIVFACVTPHPPIIVPEVGHGREGEAQATIAALARVAAAMACHAPQTAVLVGVHGPIRSDAFGILAAPVAEGDFAMWGAPQVRLSFANDLEAVALVREEAARAGLPLQPIQRWDEGLDWSCTVPLYYLRAALADAKVVPLQISFLSPQEHFAMGAAVRRAVDRLGRSVAIIASADLSHRLKADGPYGFDPAGPLLDRRLREAVAAWDVRAILEMDADFRQRAGDDAVPSLSLLMGALDGLTVRPQVLSYEGPWGVGYMVAAVEIEDQQSASSTHPEPTNTPAHPVAGGDSPRREPVEG